jgi:hypothetical protein
MVSSGLLRRENLKSYKYFIDRIDSFLDVYSLGNELLLGAQGLQNRIAFRMTRINPTSAGS